MSAVRDVEITLTIPDNEARTALSTLQRLGVAAVGLERADVYRCEVESHALDGLVDRLRARETIFNPNKHALRAREGVAPQRGEVWIEARDAAPAAPLGDDGAVRIRRFTAWRVYGADGMPASAELVEEATRVLLCNPAFEKATT